MVGIELVYQLSIKLLAIRILVYFVATFLVLIFGACIMFGNNMNLEKSDMKVTYTDAQGAAQLLAQNPDMKIIDVRTLAEFKSGHIDGAIRNGFIGFGFKNRLQVFDKDKEYLIACRTGHRSIPALKSFSKLGFTHIIHLDGGMQAWKKADLPVTK